MSKTVGALVNLVAVVGAMSGFLTYALSTRQCATSSSERDNYLDGEWQKAPSECEYAMG